MSTAHVWSLGQRALLRFLAREGLLPALPEPPAGDEAPSDARLFALIAETVPPSVLAETIAARLHLPLLAADDAVDASAGALLAATVAERCGAIPVGLQGDMLEVATANPLDLDTVKTIEFATGRRVRVRVATPETVRRLLARLYGTAEAVATAEPVASGEVVPPASAEALPGTEPSPRHCRLIVLSPDPAERDRLAAAVHDGAPDWLVVTAQDAVEAQALAAVTRPDVLLADSAASAAAFTAGAASALPCLVAADWNGPELIARARRAIDTAQRG